MRFKRPRSQAPSKLRILITSNTLSAGGAEKQRILLANELADQGHCVTLRCLQASGVLREQLSPKVRVRIAPFWVGPFRPFDAIVAGTTNTENAYGLLCRLAGGTTSRWVTAIHNPVGPTAPRLKLPSRIALHLADSVIGLSDWHAEMLALQWNVAVDQVISNGIDLSWCVDVRNARSGIREFPFDIGFIGRLDSAHKGLDLFLNALSQPAAGRLSAAIAGTGPDANSLAQRAAEMGLSDRLHWVGHQKPSDFFLQVKALALFSRFEGQPMVLLEAQGARVPVVASVHSGAVSSSRVCVVDTDEPTAAALALASQAATFTDRLDPTEPDPPSASTMATVYAAHLFALKAEPAGWKLMRFHRRRPLMKPTT